MATKLTKKQQGELTEKLTGIIQKNNALQLRLSMDRSVNEMNVNQISGALNRIHGQAIGKEMPTEIPIPVNQLGSGDPSPDNVRPIVGYEVDGIGTVYGGELNIEAGVLTVTYGIVDLGTLTWNYGGTYNRFYANAQLGQKPPVNNSMVANIFCSAYKTATSNNTAISAHNKSIGMSNTGRIDIRDESYTDAATLKTSLIGVQLVYELETPETYTLTPQQMIQLLDQL